MNLSRFLSASPKKCSLLLQSSSFCSKVETLSPAKRSYKRNPNPNPSKRIPRPAEIPFQAAVTNHVQFMGSIGVPLQLQTLPTGVFAVSVLVQETATKGSPYLCIPVIFQGDLAQIAAFHLKENDIVYVSGCLSGDASPRTVKDAQGHIQVLANTLTFVQKTCPERETEMARDQDDMTSDCAAKVEENLSNTNLWNDLLAHPENWWDNRSSMRNQACAAFKHKKSGQQLWINDSTPEGVLSKLDTLFRRAPSSANKIIAPHSGGVKKSGSRDESLWRDLVDNSQQWCDKRGDKLNGSVSAKHPDFRHKSTREGLWLDSAPYWVLQKLGSLVFYGSDGSSSSNNNKPLAQNFGNRGDMAKNEKENLWRNLVDNPNEWLDNRSNKLKPNHPDFKHKVTGKALWLNSSPPSWVAPRLPPLATKQV